MKTILSFIFVLACAYTALAQGNLQFNQVRNITHTSIPKMIADPGYAPPTQSSYGYYAYRNDSTVINVPVGKVLKIESISYGFIGTLTANQYGTTTPILQIPNVPSIYSSNYLSLIFIDNVFVLATSYDPYIIPAPASLPIWLSAGNHTIKVAWGPHQFISPIVLSSVPSNQAIPCKVSISSIEFNIVP